MASSRVAQSGHAFGLWLESQFQIPGLDASLPGRRLPKCELRLVDTRTIERQWAGSESRRLLAEGGTEESPARTIDHSDELGFRLFARYFGTCVVGNDGARIDCIPPPVPTWRWQRFLVGRALPLAALRMGYEVFHASAVSFDGQVTAIAGPSGRGKTSLAINLVLQSPARFVTDDVLTVSVGEGQPIVHPGIGVSNVRSAEEQRLGAATAQLGQVLGQTGRRKSHYGTERETAALPLKRLYVLGVGTGRTAVIKRILPDAHRLLGNAFIITARDPSALSRLLHASAQLAASVELFEIALGVDEGPTELAQRLVEHASLA